MEEKEIESLRDDIAIAKVKIEAYHNGFMEALKTIEEAIEEIKEKKVSDSDLAKEDPEDVNASDGEFIGKTP